MFNNYDEHWKFWYQPGITFDEAIYVHPLKQWDVQLIREKFLKDSNIVLMVIFGSAVSIRCHSESDVDVYIETKDGRSLYKLPPYTNLTGEVDVVCNIKDWTYGVAKAIARDGIVIFDRR